MLRRFDEQLSCVMAMIMDQYFVVPKGLVDRLIGRPIMWDLKSGPRQNDSASELSRLLRELYEGREWNENDLTEARDELFAAANKSGSPSVSAAATLVTRHWAAMLDEYRAVGIHVLPAPRELERQPRLPGSACAREREQARPADQRLQLGQLVLASHEGAPLER